MLEVDLDEDTHLCIKCDATIIGLDSYVRHRKTNCVDKRIRATSMNRIMHTDHTYRTFDYPESANYDIGTDDHHHDNTEDAIALPHPRESVKVRDDYKSEPNKSLSDSYDYNYGLGADDFFSMLNLQSSSKSKQQVQPATSTPTSITSGSKHVSHGKTLARKTTANVMSRTEHDDDWINAPSTSRTDKLMKAVRAISGTRNPQAPSIYHYGFSHDSPEPPSEEDEDEDYTAPPRTHTGGKWKPSERSHRTLLQNSPSRWYERWDLPEDSHHVPLTTASNEDLATTDEFHPPPSHTKGKWVPGTKIIKLDYKAEPDTEKIFSEQFWCNSCNRKLSSRAIYDRHLKSKLHLKRSRPETELEEASLPLPRIEEIVNKRVIKPSIYVDEKVYTSRTKKGKKPKEEATKLKGPKGVPKKKSKRNRRCQYVKCDVCKTRLREYLFGKHLISHYHYRRMFKQPEDSFDTILQNMHRIVLQSPYQCQPCHFYANTEETFMRHWCSKGHEDVTDVPGRFWCNFCKFECEDNNQMRRHLVETDHQEVVRAINRSVPIIIRKRTILSCQKCGDEFQYNIELKKHAERCTRSVAEGTASIAYQDTHRCGDCGLTFKSTVAFQRHNSKMHLNKTFYCRPCGLSFPTAITVRRHRTSAVHKVQAGKLAKKGNLTRKCTICGDILEDLLLLKEHLKAVHPDESYP